MPSNIPSTAPPSMIDLRSEIIRNRSPISSSVLVRSAATGAPAPGVDPGGGAGKGIQVGAPSRVAWKGHGQFGAKTAAVGIAVRMSRKIWRVRLPSTTTRSPG